MRAGVAALALILTAAALLGAGCGASSPPRPPGASAATAPAHVFGDGVSTHRPASGSAGAVHSSENREAAAAGPGAGNAARRSPCTLVSRAEAQRILGAAIASMQQAPLGPTCIYQPAHAASAVTLAVEAVDFRTLKRQISHLARVSLAGHTAYCGTYGRPSVFVPLAGGMVLNVAAGCAPGARFAATALARLGA
jgi:hypothetical protein